MSFDKPTRNRLSSFVGEARRLIADEFTQQFQGLYGISDKGTITPIDQLRHLDDIGLATAALLRERIDYLFKTHPEDRDGIKAAVVRLAREQAFTILNRLAAIRMAEKRGFITESVGKGYQSKGFKVFEQVAGTGLGDTYHRYRRYLFCLFDELAVDLGVLFDRRSPQGLLFPRETALLALIALLNAHDLDPLWAEDETIGWLYQYYNDPAERKKMREESAAPRNSRELAVRNQFFTPRYVVEFLTDNTLGRIWYEMTQGKTQLTVQCRYLVRRPTEIFLKPGETAPESSPQEGLSQEELLKQPVYIPFRALKDPRELLMLDPACGSMHFGLYAFDLFETIYEEAWDLGFESLRRDYPEKDAFLRDVPRLIIEHNIHGIDIDPRAVQIAGLSLWLRAQKSWQTQRLPAARRPRILRSNIVCAEPMPGSPELLKEFTTTLHPPLLGQLVEKVFVQMQLAGEAGSLLKIEEEIATLVKDAKKLWQTPRKAEQMDLSLGLEPGPKQTILPLDVSGISDEAFWETAEEQIYTALRAYAEQAESGGYQRRLFAEDAARGFAFIDLFRKRYDVVVMNPPFGDFAELSRVLADAAYPNTRNDIYAAFVERASEILITTGRIGAITPRTWLTLTRFEGLREFVLDHLNLKYIIDLGYGVLESMAEVAVYVISRERTLEKTAFLAAFSAQDKTAQVSLFCEELRSSNVKNVLLTNIHHFGDIPQKILAFGIPSAVLNSISQNLTLERSGLFAVKQGIATGDNDRFLRLITEVPVGSMPKRWAPYAKGGDFGMFYTGLDLAVNWNDDGREIKIRAAAEYGSASRTIKNVDTFFKPGLTFSLVSQAGFSVRVLPAGCIYDMGGPCIFQMQTDSLWSIEALLSLLNSSFIQYCLNFLTDSRHWHVITVQSLPIWNLSRTERDILCSVSNLSTTRLSSFSTKDETNGRFVCPVEVVGNSLDTLIESFCEDAKNTYDLVAEGISSVDTLVSAQFGFVASDLCELREKRLKQMFEGWPKLKLDSAQHFSGTMVSWAVGTAFGRWDIRFSTGERQQLESPDPFAPLPVCQPGMLQDAEGLPAAPKDLPAHYPLRISWHGILVDDENHSEDIVVRVREVFEAIWKDRSDAVENEACELLDVKTLRDYFRKPSGFFADHLKRYSKSRRQAPIYWPLSTAKGSYTLWIYYQRLSDQTLHTALADFIDPKIKALRAEISALRDSTTHRARLEELLDLEKELVDFHAEIERIIKLPWKPNLNDGVLITACPLWKLFRLPKWQKDLKACWEKLAKGDYDWAHLAYSIWPKRVEDVCRKDRSIAIAHNLEHLCQVGPPKPKTKRGRKGRSK